MGQLGYLHKVLVLAGIGTLMLMSASMAGVLKKTRAESDFARFAQEVDLGMQKMMHDMHAPGMTGDADVDFLAMMIPHHEGAVDMARLVLIHGRDPLVRQLANEIIASQQAEISAMRARLQILRRGRDSDPDGFPAVHGTRGVGDGLP